MKLSEQMESLIPRMVRWKKIANSKWQIAAILPIIFGSISAIYCPINAKFVKKKQNHAQTRSLDQNTKFQKFQMVDGYDFENVCIIW